MSEAEMERLRKAEARVAFLEESRTSEQINVNHLEMQLAAISHHADEWNEWEPARWLKKLIVLLG